jgi:release factor glutamine methyltransferase
MVETILKTATMQLEEAGVPSARLDVLILLEDLLGKDRGWLLAHPEAKLSSTQLKKLNIQIDRRARHEPLAYIRGFSEFYGRRFKVNKRVLEPRPESETMIDLLKKLDLPARPAIADIGTGSGCLGITAALEIPTSTVDLYDIDSSVLAIAKHNAHMHELTLNLRKRNLLNRPLRNYTVVLANLPYLPHDWQMHESILMEPRLALNGGKEGLDLYRQLFDQLAKMKIKPKFALTESLPPQHNKLSVIAKQAGYEQIKKQDLIQVFRLLP